MITCPSCNTQNEDGVKFCVSCGTPFATGEPPAGATVACPSCAAANPPDAQFCVSCGTPLNTGFAPAGDQRTMVSAGHVPEPPADVVPPAPPPVPSDATILAPRHEPAPAAPPPADATVLASKPEAAWPPPPDFVRPAPPVPPAPSVPAAPPLAAPGQKQRFIAFALEIGPALVGVFGLGWIYSGQTVPGVLLLIGMLLWEGLGLVVAIFTLGAACLCVLPVNVLVIAVSAGLLYSYTRRHPELFAA